MQHMLGIAVRLGAAGEIASSAALKAGLSKLAPRLVARRGILACSTTAASAASPAHPPFADDAGAASWRHAGWAMRSVARSSISRTLSRCRAPSTRRRPGRDPAHNIAEQALQIVFPTQPLISSPSSWARCQWNGQQVGERRSLPSKAAGPDGCHVDQVMRMSSTAAAAGVGTQAVLAPAPGGRPLSDQSRHLVMPPTCPC